jgi:excisionase family DNA binding protein
MIEARADGRAAATKLLTRDDLCERLRLSKRTISRMLSAGKLPPPVQIGRCVRWRERDIERWIEDGCPATK